MFFKPSRMVLGLVCGVVIALSSSAIATANYSDFFPEAVNWWHQGYPPTWYHPVYPTALCYNAHLSNVGWQGWKCDGAVAGNGVNKIEAVAFSPSAGYIMVQPHMSNVGWGGTLLTGYDDNGHGWIGTTGQNRALEAFAIVGSNYGNRTCGQANVQGQGWGAVQHSAGWGDIITLGTWGLARNMMYFWLGENC